MKSPDPNDIQQSEGYQVALAQSQTMLVALRAGCLWGIGLVLLFGAISGLVYLIGANMDIDEGLHLLLAVASGPICGTALVVVIFYGRGLKAQRELLSNTDLGSLKKVPEEDDETTSGYTA